VAKSSLTRSHLVSQKSPDRRQLCGVALGASGPGCTGRHPCGLVIGCAGGCPASRACMAATGWSWRSVPGWLWAITAPRIQLRGPRAAGRRLMLPGGPQKNEVPPPPIDRTCDRNAWCSSCCQTSVISSVMSPLPTLIAPCEDSAWRGCPCSALGPAPPLAIRPVQGRRFGDDGFIEHQQHGAQRPRGPFEPPFDWRQVSAAGPVGGAAASSRSPGVPGHDGRSGARRTGRGTSRK